MNDSDEEPLIPELLAVQKTNERMVKKIEAKNTYIKQLQDSLGSTKRSARDYADKIQRQRHAIHLLNEGRDLSIEQRFRLSLSMFWQTVKDAYKGGE